MLYTSEIYLTEKNVSQEKWGNLIKAISNYNGILKRFKIIMTISNNQVRYYIETKCSLPPTMNHLFSFLLKRVENKRRSYEISYPIFSTADHNFLYFSEFFHVKKKEVVYIEIYLRKMYQDCINKKVYLYIKKQNRVKRHRLYFSIPSSILSIDFSKNTRYNYKSSPKYLDISKTMHLFNSNLSSSIIKIDTFPYLQGNFYLSQNNYNFDKHSIIIGSSGSGKSKFISLLINNIRKNVEYRQKYKVVLIDPHASLEKDIGGVGRVLDFKSQMDSIDLFQGKSNDVISSTELLLGLFKSLLSDQYNSKLERLLRHSIHLLLTSNSFNFTNLRKLILNSEYRTEILNLLKDEIPFSVTSFFLADFNDLKTKSYTETISPIIAFLDEMEMIPVFNDQQNPHNLKEMIEDHFLTLFSLDRTKLGDKITKTISGLVMQQLLLLVQSNQMDYHILFIIDEISTVENPILCRFLSEARKYNLSLILAEQYFNQISESLKDAIFANVCNYYIFRTSRIDANLLVDNFNMKIPLDDVKDQKIKLLTELKARECVVRIDSNGVLLPAFKARTLDFQSIPRIKQEMTEDIKNSSPKKEKDFTFDLGNVDLKSILISNSSSRKELKK